MSFRFVLWSNNTNDDRRCQIQMTEKAPNTIPWPPLIYALSIVAGVALNWIIPFTSAGILLWPGLALLAGGLGLDVWAIMTMRRAKTNILPNRAADRLMTAGPFALMRHPIYMGNTIATAGLGLVLGNAWIVLFAPVAAWFTNRLAVVREEAHLNEKFGEVWRAYAAQVKRWWWF